MNRDLLELGSSLGFLDEMHDLYQRAPGDVDASWGEAFGPAPSTSSHGNGNGHAVTTTATTAIAAKPAAQLLQRVEVIPTFSRADNNPGAPRTGRPSSVTLGPGTVTPSIWPLVHAFRHRGHFAANLDPLGLVETAHLDELEPTTWGFAAADLARPIAPTGVHGLTRASLAEIIGRLRSVYCASVGLEFMHISSPERRSWLADRMEQHAGDELAADVRRRMLSLLVNAEQFERFCHTKFPGTKRFSLEGSESFIPALDLVLTHAGRHGAIEAVVGMAHRGRLTTIESILHRPARDLFAQFEDVEPEKAMGGGDVKYHLGFSTDRTDPSGRTMHVSLAFNPSHLEAVDPVVVGRVRAKQVRHGDVEHRRVVGVLVHGDAAFAGQGLVPETLQLSGLAGYRTGGTVHLVINNQVGFTASPAEQRSTPYCTDVAKMIECPIWHVNGEDLDALARVIEMAADYRAQFASDVVIDIYCYRKYGHNENDEPSFTQPLMYDRIRQKPSPVEIYGAHLVAAGVVTADDIAELVRARVAELDAELDAAKAKRQRPEGVSMTAMWRGYRGGVTSEPEDADTKVPRALLESIAQTMTEVPDGFTPHPKIVKLLEQRAQMGKGERPIDWGMGELFAYGSLLCQGVNVRLSGQDCSRGTFSHRHVSITDIKTGREHLVLGGLHEDQGQCRIYDSSLSEAGVLGFEFGYSLDYPDALVMWEAQFGDFANGAQVIIDQFITSSEDKWRRLSGLVLLLPHGYEGQGPEHSSARLERYLESCAEHNIQVAQPTTPAQMFHLLRGQVLRNLRKPLVIMTPKSLLRLPAASSTLDDLALGKFHRVLHDEVADPADVTRVLFCTGKIYYELADERSKRGAAHVAIVRIEKLYPWWPALIAASIEKYGKLAEVFWVQDEPANMGAAPFIEPRLDAVRLARNIGRFEVITRVESASPATGSHKAHVIEQGVILKAAFDLR